MEYINGNILLVITIVVINSLKLVEGSLEFIYQFMGTLGFLCNI